jgi:hypothetical protein
VIKRYVLIAIVKISFNLYIKIEKIESENQGENYKIVDNHF